MDPQISEFSYGFALTSELIATFGLKAAGAPEFATQNAEGKAGGGWDVKLPAIPVYLQFKRAYRMVRRTAKESSCFANLPFYRMHIHRRDHSDQQQLLLDLEEAGNIVRYAAPSFSLSSELHDLYSSDQVARHSIFVRPTQIGPLLDDAQHWVAFQTTPRRAYFCSEPRELKVETPEILFKEVARGMLSETNRRLDESFFDRIGKELIDIYGSRRRSQDESLRLDRIRAVRQRRRPAEFAQLVSQTLFDCELLIYSGG